VILEEAIVKGAVDEEVEDAAVIAVDGDYVLLTKYVLELQYFVGTRDTLKSRK